MNTIVFIAEGIATLLATWFYYKYKNTGFKYLLPYLWVMLFMENANHIVTIPDFWQFVRWNLFGTLRTLLFMWMFKSEVASLSKRKVITIFMITVIAMYAIQVPLLGLGSLYTVGNFSVRFLLIATIAIYASDLFSRTQAYKLGKDPVVWIAITFLIISASFPVIQTAKLFYYGREPLFSNIKWVMTAVIILMYTTLSFGFIWSEKRS